MSLSAGEQLGPYEILAPIRAGGMGEVYKALDTRLHRIVAIKKLKRRKGGRFEQEARAIAALNHPHICQIYDIGNDYLVMEYVDGAPIQGPMPIGDAVRLAIEIATALEEAHNHGILHRDLKPDNILVTRKGASKLIDFGLAKLEDQTTDVTETMEGTVVGTIPYMSPEQVEGQPLDVRSDIFSLGTVLYEVLAGVRAFSGNTKIGVLTAVLRDNPQPLPVPDELQSIVQRCLEKDLQTRYQCMGDLIQDLRAFSSPSVEQVPVFIPATPSVVRTTVGRDKEREQLWRAYQRSKENRGLIASVTGEAGIGKTSLLEQFLGELASQERPVIARGRCSERLAGNEAYLPILEALDSLLHPQSGPSAERIMRAASPTWHALASRAASEQSSADHRDAILKSSHERMKREFVALAQELARAQPLVIFIEDLHWADVSTVDILNYIAGHFADTRVLIVITYRPSDMNLANHPFLSVRNDLRSRGLIEEIPLHFLRIEDLEHYLELEFPGNRFPKDFASMIHAKTEGRPLFMADLIRYLRDTGGIVERDGVWVLDRSSKQAAEELPESVRGMIQRKIGQVSEEDRKLLVAASVQGHEFDTAVVSEVMGIDPADVEDRLEQLERVHVFVRRGDENEFPDHTLTLEYHFVHVLYQNFLYASLQPTRRASLSGRVARALVTHYRDQIANVAARVAVLFETARDFASSAKYFELAARRSASLFAFDEALSLAERGLKALQFLPDDAARQQQELALQMTKGVALRSTSGWATPEIERVFMRARELCQAQNDPPQFIPVLWATTLFFLIRGDLLECRNRADELTELAERSGERAYIMAAHHISGVVREFIGDMVEGSRRLELCRELHDPAEHLNYVAMFGQDPGMSGRAMSSRLLWILGYPDRALERALETHRITQSLQQPTVIAFALVVVHGIHLYRGEAEKALAVGDEIRAICSEYALPQESLWSQAFQGYALYLLGRKDEGIAMLQDSLDQQQAISAGLVRPAFLALLADALCNVGRIEDGYRAIDEGFAHAERTAEGGYIPELHRVRGELHILSGKLTEAEESFRGALTHARSQQAKSFELRAATGFARFLLSQGRRAEARSLLMPVYEWFTEGHQTADLVGARTLLSEIG